MLITFYRKILMYNRIYLLLFGADLTVLNRPSKLIKSGSSYWKDPGFSLNESIDWSEITNPILLSSLFLSEVDNIFSQFIKKLLTDDERLKFHPKSLKMLTAVFSQTEIKEMVHAPKSIKTSICEVLENFQYEKTILFLQWIYFSQIEDEKLQQRVFKRFKISKDNSKEFETITPISTDYLNEVIDNLIQLIVPCSCTVLASLKQENNIEK